LIKDIKKDLPKLGDEIKNGLELLQGDERLDAKAIKGLKKEFKEWSKKVEDKIRIGFVGGTPRPFFIDNETPLGTVNGTNKAFTINNIPSPAISLVIYVNGQRMKITEDYTFAIQTITFVTAPPTNSILTCDYRM